MFALSADLGNSFLLSKAASVVITTAVMNHSGRLRMEQQACEVARRFGISAKVWKQWRKGYGARRDLLMLIDPEREAERIRQSLAGRKAGPKTSKKEKTK